MFLVVLVCLFVCKHYSKSHDWVAMTFYGDSRVVKKITPKVNHIER